MSIPETQVVAVCDVKRAMRERAKQAVDAHYGNTDCAVYNDFRELLDRDDIDAVSIATLDSWHVLHALAAVRAGKDIYVEKPLGMSIQEIQGPARRRPPLRPRLPVRHATALEPGVPPGLRDRPQRTPRQSAHHQGRRARRAPPSARA